ncbi:hypothetical protein CEXT_360481 [Caerostris extrusa]|uniref:Uncharacterized protein n=1 Tax=Caerostris extrusa TaxID=172846 RepID=A0AAV4XXY6_CAEEX|nr:hypothetical protein CEXT_360481 [Caerostris extrusa]
MTKRLRNPILESLGRYPYNQYWFGPNDRVVRALALCRSRSNAWQFNLRAVKGLPIPCGINSSGHVHFSFGGHATQISSGRLLGSLFVWKGFDMPHYVPQNERRFRFEFGL